MANVHVLDHPLIQHKLAILRNKKTSVKEFRELVGEIAGLMCYEATRNLPTREVEVQTPVATAKCRMLSGKKLAIVPVLRAGLGMSDGLLELMPSARVGHIGMYRDENKRPVEYLVRLPNVTDRLFIICDPMLATGYSAAHAVDVLKKRGVPGTSIRFLALVSAPEGVAVMQKLHPDVEIYVASLDEKLDENAYIVPGLGDAGDRLFGTK